ncbi:isoprenylcysteine carboxylmethyltransferase family protein [Caulobacter sp. 17J65-9]|uniref:methyltransferase family protein n=1 Tax=Caulobacter sp. 17J65-9 TaxID=2709382 RepID=UPI0013CADC48|nr:isoprenylcysteine carboxylmethyltransferase family protein [Caulobacter sp. 17J65-9]NEX94099.1 isoprenylcysteine carboxylmethyltransferase family protein [Caulobacter sp. 17J65-9]
MTRKAAALGTLLFLLAPATVACLVPWWISGWWIGPPLLGLELGRWIGAALTVAGLGLLLDCYARFVLQGFGTPAPVAPPSRLVVGGVYRHVRNPIYVAVTAVVFGQGLLFGSAALLAYAVLVWLVSHLFVLLYEEPDLRRRFPDDYPAYVAGVPRWIPRLTPWRGS